MRTATRAKALMPGTAVALAMLGAVGTISASAAPTAPVVLVSKGPPAAPHTFEVPGQLTSISCASRSVCFAITLAHKLTRWGVIRITHKGAASHTTLMKRSLTPTALSCPSPAGCELLAQRAPTGAYVVMPVSIHGAAGRPNPLGAGSQPTVIACHPTRAHCTIAGVSGSVLRVVTVNGTTPSNSDLTLPSSMIGTSVTALACPTAAQCFAVGRTSVHGKERGLIIPIQGGVPGRAVSVTSASYDGMTAIACTSATRCDAVGLSRLHSLIYSLSHGRVTRTATLKTLLYLSGIACHSARVCDAVGARNSGTSKGAIVPVRNGRPGAVQTTSVTPRYVAGGTTGSGPIAGFPGGIEIIGADPVNTDDTVISSS